MTDQALVHASVIRLFDDGELAPEVIAEVVETNGVSRQTRSAELESLVAKLPPELLTRDFGQSLASVTLEEQQAFFEIIRERWEAEGAINDLAQSLGWVGQPVGDFRHSRAGGYLRHFEHATIYWTRSFGAKEVHGAIRQRYFQMGAEHSYLGFPQTNELSTMSGNGQEVRYSRFQGGTILWTMTHGAYQIPSFSPITERHALGAWLHMVGTGFTPNSRVSYWIVNAPNAPKSIGSEYAATDGRVGANPSTRYVVDLRNLSGDRPASVARAVDEATGQEATLQLSYALR